MTTWNNLETLMQVHLIKKKCVLLTMSEQYLYTKTEEIWGWEMKKFSLGDNQVRNALSKQCSAITFST